MATKKIKLCTNDVWKDIKAAVKPVCLTDLAIKFNVVLEVDDKLYDLIEDDAYLADKIFAHVSKEYKLATSDLAKAVKTYDEVAQEGGEGRFEEAKKACERYIELCLEAAAKEIEKNGKAEIQKMLKDRKDKTNYRIVFAKDLAFSVAGTVMSSLSVASASVGNIAGLVLGIIGLLKSLKKLITTVADYLEDIVDTALALDKELQGVLKKYAKEIAAKKSSSKVAASEIGAAVFEELFGFSFFDTITGVKKTHGNFLGKLAETRVSANDLGKELNKTLDKQEDLLKELDKLQKQATKTKDTRLLNKLSDAKSNLGDSTGAVTYTIGLIGEIDTKIKKAEKDAKKFSDKLETLEKIKGRNLEMAEKIITIVIGLGADFGGSVAGAGSLAKLGAEMTKAEGIIEKAITAIEVVDKLVSD
ncbi:MAG: hypothetical protein ACI89L_001739 [Phycisphaerales bacterium]|jgi:hypothetical protein